MKAREVREYLISMDGGWVNWADTVDTFKAGDPESTVTGIAVGWMAYTESLKRAHDLGCNLFVCHEPLFYDHRDENEAVFRYDAARSKREWLDATGMVVLRCHDLWDQVRTIGIPDSWGQLLGLGEPTGGEGYYRVYDVSGETAESVARRVAQKTASLAQQAVQLIGPPHVSVSRLVLGTGAITPLRHYLDAYRPDIALCTDDGFSYWRDGALAIDSGFPVIVVNHAVSEINGLRLLAEHLDGRFADVPVHFISQSCMYRLVRGDS